jgi:hypothetical protein
MKNTLRTLGVKSASSPYWSFGPILAIPSHKRGQVFINTNFGQSWTQFKYDLDKDSKGGEGGIRFHGIIGNLYCV